MGDATVSVRPSCELDAATLGRARTGDRKALEALVRCYQDRVWALSARMLLRRPELVPDVAQTVFVKVIGALPRFEPAGTAKLSTWILTIATRTCLDVLRRPSVSSAEVAEPQDDAPDPERAVAARELSSRVQTTLAAMPAEQRAVLVLRAYHDLDYDEIALALGIERGTVKSRLSRARAALQQALARPGEKAASEVGKP